MKNAAIKLEIKDGGITTDTTEKQRVIRSTKNNYKPKKWTTYKNYYIPRSVQPTKLNTKETENLNTAIMNKRSNQ